VLRQHWVVQWLVLRAGGRVAGSCCHSRRCVVVPRRPEEQPEPRVAMSWVAGVSAIAPAWCAPPGDPSPSPSISDAPSPPFPAAPCPCPAPWTEYSCAGPRPRWVGRSSPHISCPYSARPAPDSGVLVVPGRHRVAKTAWRYMRAGRPWSWWVPKVGRPTRSSAWVVGGDAAHVGGPPERPDAGGSGDACAAGALAPFPGVRTWTDSGTQTWRRPTTPPWAAAAASCHWECPSAAASSVVAGAGPRRLPGHVDGRPIQEHAPSPGDRHPWAFPPAKRLKKKVESLENWSIIKELHLEKSKVMKIQKNRQSNATTT